MADNLTDGLARRALDQPFAVALIHGRRIIHYGTLERIVRRTAGTLHGHGVRPGQVVAIHVAEPLPHLLLLLALARLGAVKLSLPPGSSAEQRGAMLDLARAAWTVVAPPAIAEPGPPAIMADPAWLDAPAGPSEAGPRGDGGDAPWALIGSSGTTGAAKLFPVSHAKELRLIRRRAQVYRLPPAARILSCIGPSFNLGHQLMLMALDQGMSILLEEATVRAEGADVLDAIDRHAVDALFATPQQIGRLLAASSEAGLRLPRLALVMVGTAPVGERLRAEIRARLNPNLVVEYGSNELGMITTADAATQIRHPGTVGRPVPDLALRIVGEDGQPLPAGGIGLIQLAGTDAEVAYLGDALTGAAQRRDGWLQLADLAALTEDGAVIFHGRADELINCDGLKITPSEIERALLDHPAVHEAAAFPIPDPKWYQIAAAAVTVEGRQSATELLAFAHARLGAKAPRRILVLPELPRNAMGKILKAELAARIERDWATRQQHPG